MNKKRVLTVVIALLLLAALLQIDRESLFYSISRVPFWLVALMLALQVVTQLLVNLQWYKIAKIVGIPILYRDILYVNSQGSIIDSITPGVKFGGEVTRAMQISRIADCSTKQSAALVAVQKLFSLSAMFFVLLFTVGYLQFWVYGVLLVFLLLFIVILFAPKTLRFLWISKAKGFILVFLSQVESLRKNKAACVMLFLLSLFIWLLYPAKMYILVTQFYPLADVMQVTAITFAAYTVAMLPIFPGGLGGFEGTMYSLLMTMGMVASDAVVVTVFFRFVTFWFVMLVGLGYQFILFVIALIKNGSLRSSIKIL